MINELLGRATETAALDGVLAAGRDGLSGVLVLRGDAGIGKTVLLEWAAGQAQEMQLARGRDPGGDEMGFAGLHQLLVPYLQSLSRLHDELAEPIAGTILADPSRHDSHAVTAAQVARAVICWDDGHVSPALDLLRDAARRSAGISPEARDVQPLLTLAAALVGLRELGEAEDVLRAADNETLHATPPPGPSPGGAA